MRENGERENENERTRDDDRTTERQNDDVGREVGNGDVGRCGEEREGEISNERLRERRTTE
jgi:hypothetical protein